MALLQRITQTDHWVVDNFDFVAYGTEHLLVYATFLLLGAYFIIAGRRGDERVKRRFAVIMAVTLPATVIIWTIIRIWTGAFNVKVDLPVDLCNVTALILVPMFLLRRNQFCFNAVMLSAYTGTIQAFLTPHLYDAFPHITWWKFWIVHGGIILAATYAAAVMGMRTTPWRCVVDFHIQTTTAQLVSFLVSVPLDANYTYSRYPPPTGSLLDYCGPHPIYWLTSQMLCWPFFFIIHYVVHAFDKKPPSSSKSTKKRD